MRLDLYLAETKRIASEQSALLDDARHILATGNKLSKLEENGVLHALQVLVENSIGKAKQLLKAENEVVPVSAYDAFESLARIGKINNVDLEKWLLAIGLRNQIVHEYMNINMTLVFQLLEEKHYQFLTDFLCCN